MSMSASRQPSALIIPFPRRPVVRQAREVRSAHKQSAGSADPAPIVPSSVAETCWYHEAAIAEAAGTKPAKTVT